MEISFKGKRALVTGAGKGIGRDIAMHLHQYGAGTVALSRTQADLDSLAHECPGIKTVCIDISDWTKTKEAVNQLGPIDLLVNNAGVSRLDSVLEMKESDFDYVFSINVKAAINVAQEVARGMVERKTGGAIVNISSIASSMALQDHLVYCSSKAALDMATKVMAFELGRHKIRVNAVNPTVVWTEMAKYAWSDPQKSQAMMDKIPLGKFVDVEEVTNTVLFLLSDKSSMTNGVCLPIEGGIMLG